MTGISVDEEHSPLQCGVLTLAGVSILWCTRYALRMSKTVESDDPGLDMSCALSTLSSLMRCGRGSLRDDYLKKCGEYYKMSSLRLYSLSRPSDFLFARYDRSPYLDAPCTLLVRHKHIFVVVALGGLYLWKML